jgi:D-lactate dehydrogenase
MPWPVTRVHSGERFLRIPCRVATGWPVRMAPFTSPGATACSRRSPSPSIASAAVHPTCSSTHLGLTKTLERLAGRLAGDVLVPVGTTCCGTAGDRGLLHPELVVSATRDEKAGLDETKAQAYLSANRTCEMGLRQATGYPYESFVFLLEELTRPAS